MSVAGPPKGARLPRVRRREATFWGKHTTARRARPATRAAIATLAAAPQLAHAHLIATGLGPLYDGVTHFALTPESVLPMLAVAAFAGLRGKDHARRAIFVLPLAWFVGGIVASAVGTVVPDSLAWLPLLAAGGVVAVDVRMRAPATTVIAAIVGVALGYVDGAAMAQAGAGLRATCGSTAAVFVVATLAAAAASAWQEGWLRIAWRVAGSWLAASGLLLLGWSLR